MTRKDFVLIADVLNDAYRAAQSPALFDVRRRVTIAGLADKFATRLKAENPAFDTAKFMKAVVQGK